MPVIVFIMNNFIKWRLLFICISSILLAIYLDRDYRFVWIVLSAGAGVATMENIYSIKKNRSVSLVSKFIALFHFYLSTQICFFFLGLIQNIENHKHFKYVFYCLADGQNISLSQILLITPSLLRSSYMLIGNGKRVLVKLKKDLYTYTSSREKIENESRILQESHVIPIADLGFSLIVLLSPYLIELNELTKEVCK